MSIAVIEELQAPDEREQIWSHPARQCTLGAVHAGPRHAARATERCI